MMTMGGGVITGNVFMIDIFEKTEIINGSTACGIDVFF